MVVITIEWNSRRLLTKRAEETDNPLYAACAKILPNFTLKSVEVKREGVKMGWIKMEGWSRGKRRLSCRREKG